MRKKEVTIGGNEYLSEGVVVLRRPLAGQRNKALAKAEEKEGFKNTIYMMELLIASIDSHPWGPKPVRECMDLLEPVDYDALIDELNKMIQDDLELKKKSDTESEPSVEEKDGE